MRWSAVVVGLVHQLVSGEFPSPMVDEWDDEPTRSGPTIRVQIPTAIQAAGRQFNKLEMAKRIAAARQANKEAVQLEGRQLSWESQPEQRNAPIPAAGGDNSVSFENQEQMEDKLADVKRYVHLDLTAAPVGRKYLLELVGLLSKNGVGGVMVEYGERYPFNGPLSQLRADVGVEKDGRIKQTDRFAYSVDDIDHFNTAASEAQIDVIPYFDVCSNGGFVLTKMAKLRLEESLVEDFDPFSLEVKVTLEKILKQLIEGHSRSGNIHLGCAKFKSLSGSRAFAAKLKESKKSKDMVFLDHVSEMGKFVTSEYEKIRPVVWDETVTKINPEALLSHPMPDSVDLAINTERGGSVLDGRHLLKLLQRHGKVFESLWLATPYKCSSPAEAFPDVKHFSKSAQELIIAAEQAPVYANLAGIMLSGPSRVSYFSSPCSLLPVALPSMFATFLTTMRGQTGSAVLWEASRLLGFTSRMPIVCLPRPQEVVPGDYPGSEIWRLLQVLENVKAQVNSLINGPGLNSYFNPYLQRTQRVSYYRLETLNSQLSTMNETLDTTKTKLLDELNKVYDKDTVSRWARLAVNPWQQRLSSSWLAISDQLKSMLKK